MVPPDKECIYCTNCGWTHYLGLDSTPEERAKEIPTSTKRGKSGRFK